MAPTSCPRRPAGRTRLVALLVTILAFTAHLMLTVDDRREGPRHASPASAQLIGTHPRVAVSARDDDRRPAPPRRLPHVQHAGVCPGLVLRDDPQRLARLPESLSGSAVSGPRSRCLAGPGPAAPAPSGTGLLALLSISRT